MTEDMAARKLNPHTQRSHIYSCKRFAAWLKRSPDTATADEVRRFQLLAFLPVAPSLSYRLATPLSAHAPREAGRSAATSCICASYP